MLVNPIFLIVISLNDAILARVQTLLQIAGILFLVPGER
jgi:hypothetical protein